MILFWNQGWHIEAGLRAVHLSCKFQFLQELPRLIDGQPGCFIFIGSCMESLKYLSGNNSLFKELLAIFLLFGIVPDCWKDIVPEESFYFLSFVLQLENLIIVRMALISFIYMV